MEFYFSTKIDKTISFSLGFSSIIKFHRSIIIKLQLSISIRSWSCFLI